MLNYIMHHIQYWFNIKILQPLNFHHVLILCKGKEPGNKTCSTSLYNTGHVLHPVKTTEEFGNEEFDVPRRRRWLQNLFMNAWFSIIQINELEMTQNRPVPLGLLHQFFYWAPCRKTWLPDEKFVCSWQPGDRSFQPLTTRLLCLINTSYM